MTCRNSKSSAASWSIREILKLTREKNKTVVISSPPQGKRMLRGHVQPSALVRQAFRGDMGSSLFSALGSAPPGTPLPPRRKLPNPPKGRIFYLFPRGRERPVKVNVTSTSYITYPGPGPGSDSVKGSQDDSCGTDLSGSPKHKVLSSI